MNEQKITLTADRIQAEYEKGVQYNTGIGLYEDVKQCENFVEGKQWEGLKCKNLRPITMNVLDPIVHYKVAQIVSNDVDQEVEPFLPDEQAEYAAKIMTQALIAWSAKTKLKKMHTSTWCCATPAWTVTRHCIFTLTQVSSPVWAVCRAKSVPSR